MQIGSLTVSNIRLAEMIGAKAKKPDGPFLLVKSKMGGYRYWAVDRGAMPKVKTANPKWLR